MMLLSIFSPHVNIRLVRVFAAIVFLGMSGSSLADVKPVDNEQLAALQRAGVTIIDVRREDEWKRTGIIEGSHLITFFDAKGNYDVNAWLARVSEVASPEEPLILICARGVRSSKIARFLDERLNFAEVKNVTKGIDSWIKERRPVVPWQNDASPNDSDASQ